MQHAATTPVGHLKLAVTAQQVSAKLRYDIDGLGAVPAKNRQRLCSWNDDPVSNGLTELLYRFPAHTAQWW